MNWASTVACLGMVLAVAATYGSAHADEPSSDIGLLWQSPPAIQVAFQAADPPPPLPLEPVDQAEVVAPPTAGDAPPQAARPISMVTVNIDQPAGQLPESRATSVLTGERAIFLPTARVWPVQNYHWTAAATRHQPLYFEEVNAERYGYTCSRFLQPAISAAHFFGTLPALPYLKGADCPCECNYTLGHYRPGSCNPWRRHWWPLSLRGAACEAGVVTGMVFVLP